MEGGEDLLDDFALADGRDDGLLGAAVVTSEDIE